MLCKAGGLLCKGQTGMRFGNLNLTRLGLRSHSGRRVNSSRRSISRLGLNVSTRAAPSGHRRKSMAPVFVARAMRSICARASWAFSRFARTAANFAADLERPPRRPILDRYLVTSEGTGSSYTKPLSSSSPRRTGRSLCFVFTTYSLAPCRRRTSHYATRIDFKQFSQFRRRNNGLRLSIASRNVAF